MHRPYQEILKHRADFRVKYRFKDKEEGGREHPPHQGIRCDFSYVDSPKYIIWPEFEDENGNVILDDTKPVPKEGTALMWIIIPERRSIHKEKIRIGTKCFFIEGRMTTDCEVIEIIDLLINPII